MHVAECRYSGNLKFHMKLNEDEMKCYTKYKVNTTSFFNARAKNRVISVFLLKKIHVADTVET